MIARRTLLRTALGLTAAQMTRLRLAAAAAPAAAARGHGPAQPFECAWLKGQAHFLANNP